MHYASDLWTQKKEPGCGHEYPYPFFFRTSSQERVYKRGHVNGGPTQVAVFSCDESKHLKVSGLTQGRTARYGRADTTLGESRSNVYLGDHERRKIEGTKPDRNSTTGKLG